MPSERTRRHETEARESRTENLKLKSKKPRPKSPKTAESVTPVAETCASVKRPKTSPAFLHTQLLLSLSLCWFPRLKFELVPVHVHVHVLVLVLVSLVFISASKSPSLQKE